MRSINKTIIIGNLTRNPELRKTSNSESVVTFGVATNREWSTKDASQKQKSTEFHEIVAWAKLAEICEKFLKKGSLVYIEGYLKTRSWDTPEGIKKFKTEVVAQNIILLDKKGREEEIFSEDHREESKEIQRETKDVKEESKEAPPHEDNDAPESISDMDIDSDLGL